MQATSNNVYRYKGEVTAVIHCNNAGPMDTDCKDHQEVTVKCDRRGFIQEDLNDHLNEQAGYSEEGFCPLCCLSYGHEEESDRQMRERKAAMEAI